MKLLVLCCFLPLLFAFTEAQNEVDFVNGTIDDDFHCFHEYGYYADPRNCQAYYECSAWKAIHLWCPSHLWWHPILKTCHWKMETPGCYNLNHHIYFFIPNGTFTRAEVICQDIYFNSVAIESAEENDFLRDAAQKYEHEYWNDTHVYFWTSGERYGSGHREFRWRSTGEELGFTDWCDNHPKAIQCDPDDQNKDCLVLDTHYDGWWNAADCNMHNIFVCEAPNKGGPTTEHTTTKATTTTAPTPDTTTTQTPTTTTAPPPPPTTTTTAPPTTTTPGPYDGEFLPWYNCTKVGYFGFCENYYTCEIDENGNIIKHGPFHCPGETVFEPSQKKCVPLDQTHGECVKPANECEREGIFRNRRNCAKFYTCVKHEGGGFYQRDYRCADGWLFETQVGAFDKTCVRPNSDHSYPHCPFDYQICKPVEMDDSTQCSTVGVIQDANDEHSFLHCNKKLNDDFGQMGPYTCPHNSIYHQFQAKCQL